VQVPLFVYSMRGRTAPITNTSSSLFLSSVSHEKVVLTHDRVRRGQCRGSGLLSCIDGWSCAALSWVL